MFTELLEKFDFVFADIALNADSVGIETFSPEELIVLNVFSEEELRWAAQLEKTGRTVDEEQVPSHQTPSVAGPSGSHHRVNAVAGSSIQAQLPILPFAPSWYSQALFESALPRGPFFAPYSSPLLAFPVSGPALPVVNTGAPNAAGRKRNSPASENAAGRRVKQHRLPEPTIGGLVMCRWKGCEQWIAPSAVWPHVKSDHKGIEGKRFVACLRLDHLTGEQCGSEVGRFDLKRHLEKVHLKAANLEEVVPHE